MKYLQWNDIIFEYYFGGEKEHEVFLGIDKDSLIDFVLEKGVFEKEIALVIEKNPSRKIEPRLYVWNNFTQLFRSVNLSSKDVLFRVFREHLLDSITPDKMPTIFPCIALFLMPLANNPEMDPRNFYDRVTAFLREEHIIGQFECVGTTDMSQFDKPTLRTMWENLELWARSEGYSYRVKSRTNAYAKYVSPFMAESLLTATQRDKFKVIFYESGLTPDQDMPEKRIISILEKQHKIIGYTDETAWKKVFDNYKDILISEFRRQYNKWDGNTIVRLHENERCYSRDYGNNKKLYPCMKIFRGNYTFYFKAIFNDADPGSDFEYISSSGLPNFSFSISSDGYSEETYKPTNIESIVSSGEGIMLRDVGNSRNRLSFHNEDFFLFEQYFNTYTSSCHLKIGGKFYFLVKKTCLEEYLPWLTENAAIEISSRHSFDSQYILFLIESVRTSMQSHDALNCETRRSIKVIDTFVIRKDPSKMVLYQGLPAYFQIEGINVAEDKVRIVFNQGCRLSDKQLEYDEERRLWKVPVITNKLQLGENFQVYCNDELLSSARFSFGNFDSLDDDLYEEIGYDAWGNYVEEDAEFKGLTINCNPGLASMLEQNMKQFGKDPEFEKKSYEQTDFLLYWLSSRARTNKDDFTEAIRVQVQNVTASEKTLKKWSVRTLIDNYCRLGYINYAYHQGKHIIAVNRPTFILLPSSVRKTNVGGTLSSVSCSDKQYKLLLTGARTPDFIEKLLRRAEGFNYNGHRFQIQIDKTIGPLYPQRIIFWASSIEAIKSFSEKFGIQYQHSFYANSLLELLGSVDDYENYITEEYNDFRETYEGFSDCITIDYKVLSELMENNAYFKMEKVLGATFNRDAAVVSYFPGKYKEKTILWKNQKQYPIDKYWGHFIGMKMVGAKITKVDHQNTTLQLPFFIKLPVLYARALTMMTGEIPDTSNGKRIYQLCDNPFAGASSPDTILKKLNQK